ncbi:hypothetical protein ACFFX1_25830 [Dactylosporangium sucinum]|uniref:Uncharacterized protein n=1 Tax=Dactylosporangium sucinum TaxID=1424081 RepID=A0A917T764_9ACTN|nr:MULTISPECIES: hypothetical protein [Dactylosporangium]WVK83693.1 hypothetical protein KZZ52_59070 [Dactylosporangium sp. AC04546]GGM11604.1 hypothetical protein GCM10007977_010970 [Dactylosporangium sucinum]
MTPVALIMSLEAVRLEAHSALPNAPVVDDRRRESVAMTKVRGLAARTLRRAADRVEPTPALTYG